MNKGSHPLLFIYLGRRGALPQFTLDLGSEIVRLGGKARVCISRQCESFQSIEATGVDLLAVDTFKSPAGALLQAQRIASIRKTITNQMSIDGTRSVVELMPHVWSPFIIPAIQREGVRYCSVVHDANAHIGDITALASPLLDLVRRRADQIITLSKTVRDDLLVAGLPRNRVSTLFHPNFGMGGTNQSASYNAGEKLRVLFMGRIMPYKGLSLAVSAIRTAKAAGANLHLSVCGEGDISAEAQNLEAIEASVTNRWLSPEEIKTALSSHHLVLLSHIEASQSGVVAAAHGAGLPVISTPAGGLKEQIEHGVDGLLAEDISAKALSERLMDISVDPSLYKRLCEGVVARAEVHSMGAFIDAVTDVALGQVG